MFRLLARYIVALLLGAGLAGVGIRSGVSANLKNRLATEEASVRAALTATPVPTVVPTPKVANPEKTEGTPNNEACESRGNSVEEMHESAQARQHEHEDEKSCQTPGNSIEEQQESARASQMENEADTEAGEGSAEVENPTEVQVPAPAQNFMQPQNNLGSGIRMLVRDFESGFER